MKNRLATRWFLIFGGFALLLSVALCVLFAWTSDKALEHNRLASFDSAAASIASMADSVLRGREDAGVMRASITFAESILQARVFVVSDSDAPFTRPDTEPMLMSVEPRPLALQPDEAAYYPNIRYNSSQYELYAVPLPQNAGFVAIVAPLSGVIDQRMENLFLLCISSAGITLIALVFIALAASRAAAPIVSLQKAVEKLHNGDDPEDIISSQDNEMGSLARVFNSMKEAFVEDERARQDFTASISHDLRTPLTSIHGFTQGMIDGVIKPDQYPKTLEIIAREVRHMIRLTGDILEIAKIDSGRMKLNREYVGLPELRREILEGLANSYQDITRSFAAEDNVGVIADRGRLLQVFTNLIVNAFKYNKPGGEVRVRVSRKMKSAEVTIEDTGVGMSEQELAHAFDKFFRADKSRTSAKEGTGIGLYVVKRLLEMHKASIVFVSTPGAGTVVRVEIPM